MSLNAGSEKILCRITECPIPKKSKGFCNKHYTLWRGHCKKFKKEIDPEAWYPSYLQDRKKKKVCRINGCDSTHTARSLCLNHYYMHRRHEKILGRKINPETWDPVETRAEIDALKPVDCRIDDCHSDRGAKIVKGFCKHHYSAWSYDNKRYGLGIDPETWDPTDYPRKKDRGICRFCGKLVDAKNLCVKHYGMWTVDCRSTGTYIDPGTWDPSDYRRNEKVVAGAKCKFEGGKCTASVTTRGYCTPHYGAIYRSGRLEIRRYKPRGRKT